MKRLSLLLSMGLLFASCTTIRPITATSNNVGNKKGEACHATILGFIPISGDDVSIYKAAKNGGIKQISTVDSEAFWALIYNKFCTVVRGR